MLSTCRSVIVDEIHAIAGNKRGAHLALSLERLQALVRRPLVRIGLSATQKPIEEVARFLIGAGSAAGSVSLDSCTVIDAGHTRRRDLALELPAAPLEAVMSGEVWTQVYDRLAELIHEHRTTIIFVNTRRLAERVARHLSERVGEAHVAAHHGSLAKDRRFDAEQRSEARRVQGAGRNRLSGARHRYRRCGFGLPDRLDPFDQRLPAARGPRRTLGRRNVQGQALSSVARRARGVCRALGLRSPRRARSAHRAAQRARRVDATNCRRSVLARVARGRAVRAHTRAPIAIAICGAKSSTSASPCWRKGSARAAAVTGR